MNASAAPTNYFLVEGFRILTSVDGLHYYRTNFYDTKLKWSATLVTLHFYLLR